MPPSIFSLRSSSTAFMRGSTNFMKTPAKISRKIADQTISSGSGMSSRQPGTVSAPSARIIDSASEDQAGDDRQQREDLGERHTDQHGGLQLRAHLGLTGLRLGGLADEDAEADARADRGEAVSEGRDVAGHLSEDGGLHGVFPFVVPRWGRRSGSWGSGRSGTARRGRVTCRRSGGQCSSEVASWMYTAVSIVKMKACSAATKISNP